MIDTLPKNSYKVYTKSNNEGLYESSKWNGIVDSNNSTITTE